MNEKLALRYSNIGYIILSIFYLFIGPISELVFWNVACSSSPCAYPHAGASVGQAFVIFGALIIGGIPAIAAIILSIIALIKSHTTPKPIATKIKTRSLSILFAPPIAFTINHILNQFPIPKSHTISIARSLITSLIFLAAILYPIIKLKISSQK